MSVAKKIFSFLLIVFVYSCVSIETNSKKTSKEKKYFSSSGFALIYEDNLYKDKIVYKKIDNNKNQVIHNVLKVNTPIQIINPVNKKILETKIYKKSEYPKIFNIVISEKIASFLELDLNNPYVELLEIKKNKTFIAKKTNTFVEEKNVAVKAPVSEIKMDDLSSNETSTKKVKKDKDSYVLVINDFYYKESADNLMNE